MEGYRHWSVEVSAPRATVTMRVDDERLKLNSYDFSVDCELADIVERLRFEHPEVHAVVLTGGIDKVFCAGANIQALAAASHHHKVNFCKFTNETRLAIEDASAHSGQVWLAAVNGTAAGGGYELALACDEIVLVDDRASAVSLPEVPMLGVLPGTGGLTRLVDKRHVRRDRADVFATRTEGVKGRQALEWGLVDHIAARSGFADAVAERVQARAAASDRPVTRDGAVSLPRVTPEVTGTGLRYEHVSVTPDRALGTATIAVRPGDPLAVARDLDAAIVRLRFEEPELGIWILRTEGEREDAMAMDERIRAGGWLAREVRLLWKRTLWRLDLSARTLLAVIAPGSCFAGTLAELALAADQTYMLAGGPTITLSDASTGWYPLLNRLTRLESRFHGRHGDLAAALAAVGQELDGEEAAALGLVTAAPDEIDWDDEIRLVVEERASFSPDALTGMEASLRFVGPETLETKIFGRLSTWQNWVFLRPNASGPDGGLRRYGSGIRPAYDRTRV